MSKLISSSSRKYLLCQVWLTFIQRLNIFKKLTDKRTDEWTTGDKKNQLKLSAQTSSELYKYYLQSKMIKVMLSHLMSNLLKSRLHEGHHIHNVAKSTTILLRLRLLDFKLQNI